MQFDSNRAWKEASSAIAANREVVLALAGVFFLLPGLVVSLFFPQPEPTPGMAPEAMMTMMSDYYVSIAPFMLPIILFQAVGTLALLTLLTDRTRPTVGEAIGKGLKGVIPYFLAQILLGLGIGIIGGIILGIAAVTGVAALAAVGVGAVLALLVIAALRTSLTGPVIAVEGERNPIAALRRSWDLTSGNWLRIGLFYLLVGIAFFVVIMIISALIGIVVALLASPHATEVVMAVVSSGFNAILALYFVAIIAAVHRQLAGPTAEAESATFE